MPSITKAIFDMVNLGFYSAQKDITENGTADDSKDFTILNKGVNDTPLCLIENKDIFKKYTNSIFNYGDGRKYKPLSYRERYYKDSSNEAYKHRKIDEYHLRLGDSCFIIPPEYISVSDTSNTTRVPGVRTISTIKKKYGYSTTDVSIDMYFNGNEQINGFKIESPFKDVSYYVDGLRPLLAQCRLSPIMPVENEFLNKRCGIYCIAVQAITVNTVPGFPKVLKVNIQAVECNQSIYTDVPNFMFTDIIEWDLYKYNYQRLLTDLKAKNIHDTVKLKPVENFKSEYEFKISLFNDKTINDYKENEKEFMDMSKASFDKYLDSDTDNFEVQAIQFGINNIIVSPQLSNHEKPAVQYLGGGDTTIAVQIMTKSADTVLLFKNLMKQSNYIIKKLKQVSGVGFIKIDNDLLNMIGTQFMLIDRVAVETVKNFPNINLITLECVSYDIVNLMQEELEGFKPFDNRDGNKEDCISQNIFGVYNKVKQDVYSEYKMCENSNLYPDLFLPTYDEIDDAILNINKYRESKNIKKLPFDKFACNLHQDFIYGSPYVSRTVVDPDFYYAYGYNDIEKSDFNVEDLSIIHNPGPATVDKQYKCTITDMLNGVMGGISDSLNSLGTDLSMTAQQSIKQSSTIQEAYCRLLCAQEGQAYLWGATGQVVNDENVAALKKQFGGSVKVNGNAWGKRAWDCSGFCSWGIQELGWKIDRQTNSSFVPNRICKSISKSELQPGDLLISSGHVACYIGDNTTIEAMGWQHGVCKGEVKSKYTQFGRIQWPEDVLKEFNKQKAYNNNNPNGGSYLDGYTGNANGSSSNSSSNVTGSYVDGYTGNANKNQNSSNSGGSYVTGYTNKNDTNNKPTINKEVKKDDYSDFTLDGGTIGNRTPRVKPSHDYSDNTLDGGVVGERPGIPSGHVPVIQKEIAIGKWGDYHDKHDDIIQRKCKEYNLSPNWMKALIRQECDMNESIGPNAYNAVGLMQITKDPCSELGIKYDVAWLRIPSNNLDVGFKYMNWMKNKFGWTDYNDLISAHNCGPYGWRDKWKPNDRYKSVYEMRTHKEQVNKYYNELLSNGGQSGEYKDGVPSTDSSSSMIDPSPGTSAVTGNTLVDKKHGSRTNESYHGILGIPYTDYSPLNSLLANKYTVNSNTDNYTNGYNGNTSTDVNGNYLDGYTGNSSTSNDMGVIQKFISQNYGKRTGKLTYIVIHDTQNPGGTAMNHFDYFNSANRRASADFFVDSKEIVQTIDIDKNYSYHCGDGGGKYGITNQNAIGIEMCLEKNGTCSTTVVNKTISLTQKLMRKYNIPISNVVRHYDASRKPCPRTMMDNNWAKWNSFLSAVKGSSGSNGAMPYAKTNSAEVTVKTTYKISDDDINNKYKHVWSGINASHTLNLNLSKDEAAIDYPESVKSFLDPSNNEYLSTSFVDDIQYNKRGSMLRAFPTFIVMINDDNEQWFDGKKLWSNYYPYKSVISLSTFHEREQPVGTLKMSITNMSGNLTRTPEYASYKSISDDKEYSLVNRYFYKNFGFILGTPKITDTMLEFRNKINKEIKLKPGARLHVRAGYGANPFSLNTIFNGTIAEMTTGDIIDIVAQSDGAELVNNIVAMGKEDETNGTTNLSKEASNIIASLLIDRSSAFKAMLSGSRWGEASKYNIEHFGNVTGHFTGMNRELEYDLCKNIYIGRFDKALYCSLSRWNVFDRETDIEMFIYNKTPWDVMQSITNTLPEFVCQPMYHQFDSRMFFGLPTWLCKYRYDINEAGAVLEQAKTFQQMHLINSSDILDNRVKCTNKFSCTNVVTMYTVAGDLKSSPTLFSDKTIDWSKQKTKVIDTVVQQDYIGWEPLWELFGVERARENSIAIGISNLLYSWGSQYFDDLICLGKPGVKPIDQIFLDDEFANMYGICTARSVTHTISPDTGFITTISPHMEAVCSLQDSGSTNIYRSKVALLSTISSLANAKNNTVKDLELFSSMTYDVRKESAPVIDLFKTTLDKMSTQVLDETKKLENLNKLISDVKKDMTTEHFVSKSITSALDMLSNNIYFRISQWIPSYVLGFGLNDIIDYFKYQNCIIARPLIHKNSPFISGAKGQTKLIEGMSDDPFFIDEDGTYFNMNNPEVPSNNNSSTDNGSTNGGASGTTGTGSNNSGNTTTEEVVFMGDSITKAMSTYGYVSSDRVVAKIGQNVRDALNSVSSVAAKNPKIVFVMYGVNDMGNYSSGSAFASQYSKLINSLKTSCSGASIKVLSILPVSSSLSNNKKISEFNSALSNVCSSSGVTYIDITSLSSEADIEPDGIHYKKSFYPKLINHIKKYT